MSKGASSRMYSSVISASELGSAVGPADGSSLGCPDGSDVGSSVPESSAVSIGSELGVEGWFKVVVENRHCLNMPKK